MSIFLECNNGTCGHIPGPDEILAKGLKKGDYCPVCTGTLIVGEHGEYHGHQDEPDGEPDEKEDD